jgi:hypothetical protein
VPAGAQGLDRYAYVNNSPVNFIDPSGHEPNWKLRGLKRDYGRYWNDVKGAWHREGDRALEQWSNRIAAEKAAAEAAAAGTGGGKLAAPIADAGSGPHDYTTHNMVCPSAYECTHGEMLDYLLRFAYPGQDPATYVVDRQTYYVYEPRTNFPMGLFGAITVDVDAAGLTVTNVTELTHVFCCGKAERSVSLGEDGAWYATTHSFGNNIYPHMDAVNQAEGPTIFDHVDRSMLEFIVADQLMGGGFGNER